MEIREPLKLSIAILMVFVLSLFGCTSENESAASDLEANQESELIDSIVVGTQVGTRIPEFRIIYADESEVTSASLIENGKPVFMFFFTTWCPSCARELAELKEIYPEFTDDVVFISVGVDPTESISDLIKHKDQNDHPWTIAKPLDQMIADLKVTSQSTKIAFNSSGIITYRDGYGKGNREIWAKWMENQGEGF